MNRASTKIRAAAVVVFLLASVLVAVSAAPALDGRLGGSEAELAAGSTEQSGYWVVTSSGEVIPFGDAPAVGSAAVDGRVVDVEATPDGAGVWVLDRTGAVVALGSAPVGPAIGALFDGESAAGLSSTPSGAGYWVFTSLGRAFAVGDAVHVGDLSGTSLNEPVVDAIATPSGLGYYLVAADGGIFAFGDATFAGSMGGVPLNAPVVGLAPDPDGAGYWLVASDGGIFAFDADFAGSMGGVSLNRPVTGAVAHGDGYLMVASDGGVFNFSDLPFEGSLGNAPPAEPVVAITPMPAVSGPSAVIPVPPDGAVTVAPSNLVMPIGSFTTGDDLPRLVAHMYDGGDGLVVVFEGWSTVGEALCVETSWDGASGDSGAFHYAESAASTCGEVSDFTNRLVDCGDWAYVVTGVPADRRGSVYLAIYDSVFDYYAFPEADIRLGSTGALPSFTTGATSYTLPPGLLPNGTAGTCEA